MRTSPSRSAAVRAAQGRDDEAEELWRRALAAWSSTEARLHEADMETQLARFLGTRGRMEEARDLLRAARNRVDGTGAALHERLIREAEQALATGS